MAYIHTDPMGSIIDKGFSHEHLQNSWRVPISSSCVRLPYAEWSSAVTGLSGHWAMHQVHVDAKILWPVLETPGCRNTIKNNTRVDDLVKRKITYKSPISMGHFLRNQQGKQPQAAKVASSYGPQWLRCAVPGTFWVVLRLVDIGGIAAKNCRWLYI